MIDDGITVGDPVITARLGNMVHLIGQRCSGWSHTKWLARVQDR